MGCPHPGGFVLQKVSVYTRGLPPGGAQWKKYSTVPIILCFNSAESNSVTMYGRGFEKFNSAESHSVRCGFKFNNTYREGMLCCKITVTR